MEGRVAFISLHSGEYQLCISSNSSAWFGGVELRVHLSISEGENAVDFERIRKNEKLSDLELRVRSLIEHTSSIAKEQRYGREREDRFRDLSASTNQRVLWWAMLQTSILLLVGFLQIRHLRRFFEAKKLV